MLASVIICTYNRSTLLTKTLSSLCSMVVPSSIHWEVLVIDNNSNDETPQVVEYVKNSAPLNIRYISEGEQGKSFALNRGIREAKGEYILFTDDDVKVHPMWLTNTIKAFQESGASCVGGKILLEWESPCPSWLSADLIKRGNLLGYLDLGDTRLTLTQPRLYGGNFAVKSEVFRRHGFFDTNIGPKAGKMYNAEDTWFIHSLIKGGERVLYCPDIMVSHFVPKHHISKSYFRKRMFDQGELKGINMGDYQHRNIFGIPYYVCKEFCVKFPEYILSLLSRRKDLFHKEIELYMCIGLITGRLKYRKKQHTT